MPESPVIRLACQRCDTEECDGITAIPMDWSDVSEVQSYEDACRPVALDDPVRSPFEWYTHLGVCPDCRPLFE